MEELHPGLSEELNTHVFHYNLFIILTHTTPPLLLIDYKSTVFIYII